jgi:hypothetical protein
MAAILSFSGSRYSWRRVLPVMDLIKIMCNKERIPDRKHISLNTLEIAVQCIKKWSFVLIVVVGVSWQNQRTFFVLLTASAQN